MTELQPGYPALITLLLSTLIATVLASAFYPDQQHGRRFHWFFHDSPASTRAHATGIVALTFWIWAVKKVWIDSDHDLGCISFLLVIVSCTKVYCTSSPLATCPPRMLLAANGIVCLNYLLPIVMMDLPGSFRLYLGIGAVYWVVLGVWNWRAWVRFRYAHMPICADEPMV